MCGSMETVLVYMWSIMLMSPVLLLVYYRRRKSLTNRRLPPGPPGWPLFGNMFDLGDMPHRTLAGLKEKYGPVVWLKLGSVNSMVVLSAKAASELFKNHDLSFVDRSITDTMKSHEYHKASLALAPYGPYWRVLRRICTVEMLVNKRLNESSPVRQKCVHQLVHWVEKEARESRAVHLAMFVFLTSFNMLGNLMLSRDLVDPESKSGSEFFTAMMGLMEWGGHANISDVFPLLKRFDLQGLRKNMDRDIGKALEIASVFFKERDEQKKQQQQNGEGIRTNDFLDVLLEFEGSGKDEPPKLLEKEINIFVLVRHATQIYSTSILSLTT